MLKVAVVGLGHAGVKRHLPVYAHNPNTKVEAICDPDSKKTNQVGEKHAIPNRYTTIEELLNDIEVDVVDICSPPFYHFDQARSSLEAGKHVLMEKPMGCTIKESEELKSIATKKGLELSVIHNRKFYPDFVDKVNRVKSGEIGEVIRYESRRYRSIEDFWKTADPDHWVHDMKAGYWGEFLSHHIYLAYQFLDDMDIESVNVHKHKNKYEWMVVDDLVVTLSHSNGLAILQYVSTEDKEINDRWVIGEKGEIPLNYRKQIKGQPERYINENKVFFKAVSERLRDKISSFTEQENTNSKYDAHGLESHKPQIDKYIDSIINDTNPPVSWDEIYTTNKLVNEISDQIISKID